MFLEARAPTAEHPARTENRVSFELVPTNERDHLDLETGEVFQDFNYARIHKNEKKLVGASVTIHAAPEDSYYRYNAMRYMEAYKNDELGDSPSSIDFDVFITPPAFQELVDNIRSNHLPSVITIELFHDLLNKGSPIKYGWEPDGSGMIWHNKEQKNQVILVTNISFDYAVVKPQYDEEQIDRLLPSQSDAPNDRINEQIDVLQAKLTKILKYLRWTATAMAAIAVMIGVLLVTRGRLF